MKQFYDNFETRRKREQKPGNGFFSHIQDLKPDKRPNAPLDLPFQENRKYNSEIIKKFIARIKENIADSKKLSFMVEDIETKCKDLQITLKLYPIIKNKNFLSSSLIFDFFNKFLTIKRLLDQKIFRHRVEQFSSQFFARLLEKTASSYAIFLELLAINFSAPFEDKLSLTNVLKNSVHIIDPFIVFLTDAIYFTRNFRRYQEIRFSNECLHLISSLCQFEHLFIDDLFSLSNKDPFAKTLMNSFILPLIKNFILPLNVDSFDQERKALGFSSSLKNIFLLFIKLQAHSALSTRDVDGVSKILFQAIFNKDYFISLFSNGFDLIHVDHQVILEFLAFALHNGLSSPNKSLLFLNTAFYLRYLYKQNPLLLEKFKRFDSLQSELIKFVDDSNEVMMIGKILKELGNSLYYEFFEHNFNCAFFEEITRANTSFAKSHALMKKLYLTFLYSFELNRNHSQLLAYKMQFSKASDLMIHIEAELNKISKNSGRFFEAGLLIFVQADLLSFYQMTDDNLSILNKFMNHGKGLKNLYNFFEKNVEYFTGHYYEKECVEKMIFKKVSLIMQFMIDCNLYVDLIDYHYIYNEKALTKFSLEFLKDFYFLGELEGRFRIFKNELQKFNNMHHGTLSITIRRAFLVEDGINFFREILDGHHDPLARISVSFIDEFGNREEGADQGGLFKDFITEMIKVLYNPEYGLLTVLPNNQDLFLNPHSRLTFGDQDEEYFMILGFILAKSLQMGITLNVSFSKIFLRKLKGLHNYFKELKEFDKELYDQLNKLKLYENVSDLGLDFSITEDFSKKQIELIPNGSNIAVTNENVIKYTYYLANYRINRQVERQFASFVRGFEGVFGITYLKLFSEEELQKLISGTEDEINIKDLKSNTIISGSYASPDGYLNEFWGVLESFDEIQKRMLLKFVTNIDRPPIFGNLIRF